MDQSIPIKEAFQKVKEDVSNLKFELSSIKSELDEIQRSILLLLSSLDSVKYQQKTFIQQIQQTDNQTDRQSDTSTHNQTHNSTENPKNSTLRHINKTEKASSTHPSTHNYGFQDLKGLNIHISTGNRGVSTDRQTDNQTDTSTGNRGVSTHPSTHNLSSTIKESTQITSPNPLAVLNQLDNLKKEIRLKFKRLTPQEMLVFSSIYQFEDQGHLVDYTLLSTHLNISESSIRDYIQRLIIKGIPLDKEKINNKKIVLHISQELRKLATLDTLISLRDL
ncbi:MAG: hypothetical protein WC781_03210 [Candidatus Pacearchaeota archaeon]|jgi:hypothetical protein